MKSHSDQLFQNLHGRLDIGNSLLHRPNCESGMIDLRDYGYAQVLVQGHEPIPIGSFLEGRALDSDWGYRQEGQDVRDSAEFLGNL